MYIHLHNFQKEARILIEKDRAPVRTKKTCLYYSHAHYDLTVSHMFVVTCNCGWVFKWVQS